MPVNGLPILVRLPYDKSWCRVELFRYDEASRIIFFLVDGLRLIVEQFSKLIAPCQQPCTVGITKLQRTFSTFPALGLKVAMICRSDITSVLKYRSFY